MCKLLIKCIIIQTIYVLCFMFFFNHLRCVERKKYQSVPCFKSKISFLFCKNLKEKENLKAKQGKSISFISTEDSFFIHFVVCDSRDMLECRWLRNWRNMSLTLKSKDVFTPRTLSLTLEFKHKKCLTEMKIRIGNHEIIYLFIFVNNWKSPPKHVFFCLSRKRFATLLLSAHLHILVEYLLCIANKQKVNHVHYK